MGEKARTAGVWGGGECGGARRHRQRECGEEGTEKNSALNNTSVQCKTRSKGACSHGRIQMTTWHNKAGLTSLIINQKTEFMKDKHRSQ